MSDENIKALVKRFASTLARHPQASRLGKFAGTELLAGAINAHSYDMNRNGEAWLIRRAAPKLAERSVVDIGANAGEWSAHLLDQAPTASVYAVEMIPVFAANIRARFGGRLKVIECALSDTEGVVQAFKVGGGGSLVKGRSVTKTVESVDVPLRKGDGVVAEYGINNIGFIKIDVDGYDVPVIRGLAQTIEINRPIIQFEYSKFYIDTRNYLKDAYEFFTARDYRVGRLMPSWVAFSDYLWRMEGFMTNNYVAVPKEVNL